MALPAHLQAIVDNPKKVKMYKEMQHKEGVKKFGKEHTIGAMKSAYSKALNKAK